LPNPRDDGAGLTPGGPTSALALEDVSARYRGASALAVSGVTLCVERGELVALLGANGAGKSTLLRVAAGLMVASSGRACVGGRDVRGTDGRALARLVAPVPQSEPVAQGFRVRDAVLMGRAPHQGVWMRERSQDRTAVDDAIDRCGLKGLGHRGVETLSGGEQRRVAIARALAHKPRGLLLDEPVAFLDVRHRLELYELLADVVSRDGIAALVAMHDLEAARPLRLARRPQARRTRHRLGAASDVMTPGQLQAALEADVAVGLHVPSGQRYFVPLRPT
jgi:ABC-type cobalamin/Fe3+-siderophores transport system ATPase subunit